ncbi:MAG: QueT transporter family protein [Oscillospiraceae bacterium]|nr:QueT transporter family protein [Oscillospiraceae bacterium]
MNQKTLFVVKSAVIAALYAALTAVSSIFGLAYGPIQFRVSEALCVLCAFTPAAIPGLTIGCLISNLSSPYGAVDIIVGTLATLLAALLGYFVRKVQFKGVPLLTLLMPAVFNGILVGAEIVYLAPEGFQWQAFLISGLEVAIGEIAVCYTLGVMLCKAIQKSKLQNLLN